MLRPDHLFLSSDGNLFDTRKPDWSKRPLRAGYCGHHITIETTADLRATLRAGPYAWPGGYQCAIALSDGECLCFACARKEYRQVSAAVRNYSRNGWRADACIVNWEDPDMICAHCNEPIPAVYSE